jgi:ProP effector
VNNKSNLADTIEALADLFPQCFSLFQGHCKPLKIGIREDLIAALDGAITPKEVSLALAIYCNNFCYLKACTKIGTPRIDLHGNAAGIVDDDAANNAKQRLAAQRDKRKRHQQTKAQAKAAAELKARNAGRTSLADLRRAAQARRASAA